MICCAPFWAADILDKSSFIWTPIREAQIIQVSLDHIIIYYAPTKEFKSEYEQVIRSRIQTRMGDIQVTTESVQSIPRDKNGKFRTVICELSEAEKHKSLQEKN